MTLGEWKAGGAKTGCQPVLAARKTATGKDETGRL